ncbi:fimbrial protein [Proteus vulgaris]|uniref:fimbrial protein n=1 Tax=Proteus TaxID=583 RepID=UPI000D69D5A6|nr:MULTISPECIES: fimbrial protein [Proteus]MBQ0213154.1 fimbrial protein [Proteus vulgaris]MDS0788451.1 fimbrial protein [Proteus vulgaris]
MTFSKTLLITSIIAASFSGIANAAPANGNTTGVIHFKGQFIDSTCTVETNNQNQNEGTVQLGTWLTNTFNAVGEKTEAMPFTIGLSGCPATLGTARVTFEGTEDNENPSLYKVSDAKGVGIGLLGDPNSETYFTPNTEAEGITLKGNQGQKTYYARYVTTAEEVSPGNANADVTVTIKYTQ